MRQHADMGHGPLSSEAPTKACSSVPVPLCELHAGQVGIVLSLEESDSVQADRMKSLGLCAGRRIEMVKPGNPLIIRVFGSRIGLARRLAMKIMVDPCQMPGCVGEGQT